MKHPLASEPNIERFEHTYTLNQLLIWVEIEKAKFNPITVDYERYYNFLSSLKDLYGDGIGNIIVSNVYEIYNIQIEYGTIQNAKD